MKHSRQLPWFVLALVGLLLIFWPRATLPLLCRLVGIALILGAAALALGVIGSKTKGRTDLIALVVAVAMVIFGVWILANTYRFENMIQFVLGIALMLYGLLALLRGRKSDKGGLVAWLPAVAIVLGIIICFKPFGSNIRLFSVVCGIALCYTAFSGYTASRGR